MEVFTNMLSEHMTGLLSESAYLSIQPVGWHWGSSGHRTKKRARRVRRLIKLQGLSFQLMKRGPWLTGPFCQGHAHLLFSPSLSERQCRHRGCGICARNAVTSASLEDIHAGLLMILEVRSCANRPHISCNSSTRCQGTSVIALKGCKCAITCSII